MGLLYLMLYTFFWVDLISLQCLDYHLPMDDDTQIENLGSVHFLQLQACLPNLAIGYHALKTSQALYIQLIPNCLYLCFPHFSKWYSHPNSCPSQKPDCHPGVSFPTFT